MFFLDSIIEDVQVRKILDSRGNPTVEVDVITWNGFGRAAAPSGASTGSREVVSFPEGGVDVIVSEIEDIIASELIGMDAEDIATICLLYTSQYCSVVGKTKFYIYFHKQFR